MAQTFDVPNILPDIFALDDPSTGAKSVQRKNLMEIPAQHKVDFNPTNQKNIRFKLTSPGDFLIGKESYIKFNLTLQNQTATEFIRFGLGGAHNLWRNIQIRTLGGGTLLQEQDWYNMSQGLEHQFNMSCEYLRRYGPAYGDNTLVERKEVGGNWVRINTDSGKNTKAIRVSSGNLQNTQRWTYEALASASMKNDANGTLATVNQGNPEDIASYKYIAVSDADGAPDGANLVFYEVLHVSNETRVNTAGGTFYNYDIVYMRPLDKFQYLAADQTYDIGELNLWGYVEHGCDVAEGLSSLQNLLPSSNVFKRSFTYTAGTTAENLGTTIEFCFQPFMTLLQHNIPLFLFKDGIELILELNQPSLAFCHHQTNSDFTYTVTDPKFMAMMLTPHPAIQERYETMWRSEKGLIYRIPGIKVRKQTSSHDTSDILQFHCGVRSAMKAVLLMNTTALEANPKFDVTMGLPLRIKKYLWKVGGINFPNRDVQIVGTGGECYKQLLMAYDRYGETNLVHRFTDYYNQVDSYPLGRLATFSLINFDTYYTTEGTRFYIAADFRRVNGYGDNLSGIDLSHVPLDLEIECTDSSGNGVGADAQGTKQYYLFIYYDAYLKMNAQQITILS